MRPVTGIVCALLFLSGCAGNPQTPTQTGTLTEAGVHPGLTADVDVVSDANAPVRVTIVEMGVTGRGTVLDRTYTGVVDVEDEVFRENGDYRVTIRVNGTVRWDRTVKHFETVELRVAENGTVSVTSHTIA